MTVAETVTETILSFFWNYKENKIERREYEVNKSRQIYESLRITT